MRLLTRTGKSARTSVGYARTGAQITVTSEEAKRLTSEGGWRDDGAAPKRERVTEVPSKRAAREPRKAAGKAAKGNGGKDDAKGSGDGGDGKDEGKDAGKGGE